MLAWFLGFAVLLFARDLPSIATLTCLAVLCLPLSVGIGYARPVMALILALLYASMSYSQQLAIEIPSSLEGKSVSLNGEIVDLPKATDASTRFLFQVTSINPDSDYQAAGLSILLQQKIQLSCYRCSFQPRPGQRWQFTVRLKNPHGYASWGAFDFEKYLFRHQIVARGYVRSKETMQLLADSNASINTYRQELQHHLKISLNASPNALGMISALMIGDKSLLSHEQRETFRLTGVSHLMAISGLHVGLVFVLVALVMKYLLWPCARVFYVLPRPRLVLLPALAAAYGYSGLSGFAVSTQRAFTMLCVYALCRLLARRVSLLRILLLAACLLLLIDPYSILDAGYWLSCGAVASIALVLHYRGNTSLLKLQPLLWIGMLPITSLLFIEVSLISPLVNLLAVPLFCAVLIPLVLFSLVLHQIGLATLHNCLLQLLGTVFEWVYQCLFWLSQQPFALYAPGSVLAGLLNEATVLFYAGCCLLMWAYLARWSIRHRLLAAWLAIVFATSWQLQATQDDMQLALLDVGQGLAIVVQVSDYVLVYDTGPAYPSGFNTADAVLIPYLRKHGIKKIDQLIVSHADNDHIGGLGALTAAVPVENIFTSRVDRIPGAQACRAGQTWEVADIRFSIISPGPSTPKGSNNRSCVLRIENQHHSILVTGDIEKQVERYLLAQQVPLNAEVLLVPHQGSKTSSTQNFINAVHPSLAMVAAGYRNHYGHPHKDVVERYNNARIKLLSTVDSGSILLKYKDKKMFITTYRDVEKRFWNRQKKPN